MEEIWRDLELSSKELCSGFIYEPCFSNQDDVEWVFGGLETTIETDNVRGFQNLEQLETEDGEEFGHRADGVEYEGVKSEGSAVEKRVENFCCIGSWIGSPRFRCSSSSWAASGARSPSVTRPHGISPTLLDSPVIVSNSQPSPTTGTLVIPDADVISATVDSATLGVKKCDGHASFTYNSHESAVSLACLPGLGNMVSPAYEMAQSMVPELDCCVMASVQPRDDHSTFTEQLHIKDTAKNFNSCSPAEVSNNIAVNANSPAWQLHDPIDTSGSEACPDDEPPTAEENDDSEIDPMQKVASTPVGILRTSDDGYNWRKYGQKQVKGSEYPRSYYKCTHLDCPVKKKIERSQDGQITEIIYKGDHNHPILHPNRCSTLGSVLSFSESPEASGSCVRADGSPGSRRTEDQSKDLIVVTARRVDGSERLQSTAGVPDMLATEGNLVGVLGSASMPSFASQEEKEDAASEGSMSLADDDYDESGSKERKEEGSIIESMFSSRDRREPRVVVQTESQVDILDDGYRWRKYGQKVVKGNQNPRSYYKCTSAGCTVRKHVERASQDLKYVLTMYEGKHNHEIPAARNSSNRNSARDSPPAAVNTPAVFTLPGISHLPRHEPQYLVPVFNPKVGYCTDFLRPYYLNNLVGNAPLFYPMKSASFPDAIPYGSFGSSLTTIDPYSRPMVPPLSIPLPFEFPCPSDLTATGCNNHNAPVAGFQSFFAEQELRAHNMKYLRPKHEMEVDSFCCAGVSKIEQMR